MCGLCLNFPLAVHHRHSVMHGEYVKFGYVVSFCCKATGKNLNASEDRFEQPWFAADKQFVIW